MTRSIHVHVVPHRAAKFCKIIGGKKKEKMSANLAYTSKEGSADSFLLGVFNDTYT